MFNLYVKLQPKIFYIKFKHQGIPSLFRKAGAPGPGVIPSCIIPKGINAKTPSLFRLRVLDDGVAT